VGEKAVERRLAAILAADVVGYSRLMGQDETGTLAALRKLRSELVDPRISEHKGRVFKTTGDGLLAEFPSVVNAVACAVDIQRAIATRNADLPDDRVIQLRIGVNLGDVIVEGEDVFGDGVNVAARLEGIAPPGGIAVSGTVRDHLGNRLSLEFEDLGEQQLKNINSPIRVYCAQAAVQPQSRPALALPDKPSIAVLPFTNMSSEPEHESFADGLTEDLITDLSRTAGLFVIARNSTFAYKGKPVDVRRIARELGVRYLLEGSARRHGGRVRINAQLIDAIGGGHLWAERFDRDLEDIFAVQDEVIAKIVEALVGRLTVPPPRKRPKSIEAYDLCVRARLLTEVSPQASREAHMLLLRALELDPGYAEAHRLLADNLSIGWVHWGEPMETNRLKSVGLAEKAVALDPIDATNHALLAYLLAYERRWEESDSAFEKALQLDPNNAEAWARLSDITALCGRPLDAIEQIGKALRLNPYPDCWYYLLLGQAQYAARRYDDAETTLRREETYRTMSRRFLAATLAQLGKLDEARREAQMFMLSNPHFTISHWVATQPSRDEATLEHFIEGYRKAGLPE
jgi:adenylate cyclase